MSHPETSPSTPRLRGNGDLVWLALVLACFVAVCTMLVTHLESEFDAWRLANRLALEVAESERLQQGERQLRVEVEVRSSEAALPATGRRLGLGPVSPDRVVTLELP